MPQPRIDPVRDPDPEQRELLGKGMSTDSGRPLNIFGTMVHHPTLMKRFNVLGGLFMTRSVLPPRLREIVILRVADRTDCQYEWHQHVRIARECGVEQDEIELVRNDDTSSAEVWTPLERAVLAFTDDVLDDDRAGDDTWSNLADQMSDAQLLELTMLIGFYRMTAAFLNTVQVQPEGSSPS